jgi:16S rRNA (guanine1516-N2)-methyltransferase
MTSSTQQKIEDLSCYLERTSLSLEYLPEGLSLCHPNFNPLTIDFLSQKLQYRSHHGALGELLAKACGAKHQPKLLDLTAGLGRDAFVLASLGCEVLMIERHPIMHALLEDGVKRLKQVLPDFKLDLIHYDSSEYLKTFSGQLDFDVIYIDPMHPERQKSALVKKEMRILRDLVGKDEDKVALINSALSAGVKKIVLKWPLKSESLSDVKPTGVLKGKAVRFEIYTSK